MVELGDHAGVLRAPADGQPHDRVRCDAGGGGGEGGAVYGALYVVRGEPGNRHGRKREGGGACDGRRGGWWSSPAASRSRRDRCPALVCECDADATAPV